MCFILELLLVPYEHEHTHFVIITLKHDFFQKLLWNAVYCEIKVKPGGLYPEVSLSLGSSDDTEWRVIDSIDWCFLLLWMKPVNFKAKRSILKSKWGTERQDICSPPFTVTRLHDGDPTGVQSVEVRGQHSSIWALVYINQTFHRVKHKLDTTDPHG